MGLEVERVTIDLNDRCPEHKKIVIFAMSLMQVVLGLLDLGFFIGLMVLKAWPHASAIGVWGGIIFVISGVFGLVAYQTKKMIWVVVSMAMCLLSFVLAFAFFIVHCVGVSWYTRPCTGDVCQFNSNGEALNGILLAICLLMFIISVVLGIMCIVSITRHTENVDQTRYNVRDATYAESRTEGPYQGSVTDEPTGKNGPTHSNQGYQQDNSEHVQSD